MNDPDQIRKALERARTVAVVGCSPNPDRPSHAVASYLLEAGYTVVPVNPGHREILGQPCFPSLLEVPRGTRIDVVDVFRRSDAVPGIVEDAIRIGAKVVWMQLGIKHAEAAARAQAAGLTVVQNRCMKIEYGRLSGELSWNGVNSRIISSRRRRLIA